MLRQIIFFGMVLSILAVLYGSLGRRLGRHLSRRARRVLWGVLVLQATCVPLGFLVGDRLGMGALAVGAANVGFIGLGAVSILVLLLPLLDLGEKAARVAQGGLAAPRSPGRRRFFAEAAAVGLTGGLTAVGYVEARRLARVKRVDLALDGLHPDLEGLRIVQITDVHVGALMHREDVDAVVDQVLALSPDLIAVTGDLVDGSVAALSAHTAPLARLKAPLGAWFVTGNHEYYSGAEDWIAEVERLGIPVLMNEHRVLTRGAARICLGGVTDHKAGDLVRSHACDPEGAFAGAPDTDLRLLLAHQPQAIFQAEALGVDVQLSGHTHGGQYFPYSLFVHLFQPYAAGLHRVGRAWLYVSRGTGFWGPPNRAGSESEITELVLRRA